MMDETVKIETIEHFSGLGKLICKNKSSWREKECKTTLHFARVVTDIGNILGSGPLMIEPTSPQVDDLAIHIE